MSSRNESDTCTGGTYHCEVCGCDLTDPKNRGDPDVNGDWVCSDLTCRAVHEPEMTCNVEVLRS